MRDIFPRSTDKDLDMGFLDKIQVAMHDKGHDPDIEMIEDLLLAAEKILGERGNLK